ncbi:hypothetical protein DRN73_04375 [Candidatus Pacearchaeota archaeon]|nr:MAG: hypothetical protein DRN73_04375 [Candidatus Pacearchaeota archaeon]
MSFKKILNKEKLNNCLNQIFFLLFLFFSCFYFLLFLNISIFKQNNISQKKFCDGYLFFRKCEGQGILSFEKVQISFLYLKFCETF